MKFTERFLRAKHWQIFLLTFGLPMIFQFIVMGVVITSISRRTEPDLSTFFNFFSIAPVLMFICMGIFFSWFWSVGVGLQNKVPTNLKMKVGKFKVLFLIPMVYMVLFLGGMGLFMTGVINSIETGGQQPDIAVVISSMAVVIPLHFLSMFCLFYCLYFVAKTFKTVELQRETTFSDFAGEFFLIWFYPIGIWIVQPKINKMIEG